MFSVAPYLPLNLLKIPQEGFGHMAERGARLRKIGTC
jgi:hypothetical protein